MRIVLAIAFGLLFLSVPSAHAQLKNSFDGYDEGNSKFLKEMGEIFDQRTVEQICKDNALIRAVWSKDLKTIRKALNAGAIIDSYYVDGQTAFGSDASGTTPLWDAVRGGDIEVVKFLIGAKADVNKKSLYRWEYGTTPLYIAVVNKKNNIAELLVKAGAKGDPKQILLGIDMRRAACRGFEFKKGEGYPLYPGVARGSKEAPDIAEMIKRGADVDAADPEGYTPIMYATNLGLIENVKMLLAHGADAKSALSIAEHDDSWRRAERRQITELLKAHLAKKK